MKARPFKTVYVSHPLRGGMDRNNPDITAIMNNRMAVDIICRKIINEHPDVLPISPINAFSFFNVFEEDKEALEADFRLMELADELWVYGEWETSEGCGLEIALARKLAIPIVYEDGRIERPKQYRCPESGFCDGWPGAPPTIAANSPEAARTAFGCTALCERVCGCGGPVIYDPDDITEAD
ncbi:MAG: DUF4406 domain-containing protein [Synergistaceae bacterium]|nr:DUF4406 domain-containing protein [Synergistaceae bacterium]